MKGEYLYQQAERDWAEEPEEKEEFELEAEEGDDEDC